MKSLMGLCELVEAPYRFALYKRIADLCLFMLGLFPEYVERSFRYPMSGKPRPDIGPDPRIDPAEYESEGRRFYKMAAEHESARQLELAAVFRALHDNFQKAKKPLNFIAEHYLKSRRRMLFG